MASRGSSSLRGLAPQSLKEISVPSGVVMVVMACSLHSMGSQQHRRIDHPTIESMERRIRYAPGHGQIGLRLGCSTEASVAVALDG